MNPLFPLIAQTHLENDHMGGGWGWLVVIAMVVMMGGMGWMMWSMMRGTGSNGGDSFEDPAEVLKTRYARGELTTDEYQERLRTIEDARR